MKRVMVVLAFMAAAGAGLASAGPAVRWLAGIQVLATPASAFELQMRILEGSREKPSSASRTVTSSYLEFVASSNFEGETNAALDDEIRKVYSLKDVSLLSEANLVWEKGKTNRSFHIFRINGQEYAVTVTPGQLAGRNHFHIQVFEQGRGEKASLLDTEFSLPDRTAAVFGFEDSKAKSYFITLRVERWSGEPVLVEGGAGRPGAVPGVVDLTKGGDSLKFIKKVDPVYPEAARKAGVEGAVVLEGTIDTYGRVASVKVLRGIPLLDQAAVDALRQWVCEPMVVDGKPQPVIFSVTMQFRLAEKKPAVGAATGAVPGTVQGGAQGEGKALQKFAAGAVKAEGEIKPPKLMKEVMPAYPENARQAQVQGVVILGVRTDESGKVVDVMVLRSVPLLDQAAIDAVKQWVYEPVVLDGKPRPCVFTATVRFVLK